jgi:hypothetical protein
VERRKRNARFLAKIESGEVLLCRACKCKPRYLSGGWVTDYCYDCYRAYQNNYNARRRNRRRQEKQPTIE